MNRFRIPVPVVLAALAALAPAADAHKGDPDDESLITARSGLPAGFAALLLAGGAAVVVARRHGGATGAPGGVAPRAEKESW